MLEPTISSSTPFAANGCSVRCRAWRILSISLAYPKYLSNLYLREWVKSDYNPIIVPDAGVNVSALRDPTTAWEGHDGIRRLVIDTKDNHRGLSALYCSCDFKRWAAARCTPATPVCGSARLLPVTSPGVDDDERKHVFKVSLDLMRYDYASLADGNEHLRYDCNNFYASKTFLDSGKQRRVLWGRQLLRGHGADHADVADVEASFQVMDLDKAEPFDPAWRAVDAETVCAARVADAKGGVGPFGLWVLTSDELKERTAVFFRVFKRDDGAKHAILVQRPFVDVDIAATGKIPLRTLLHHLHHIDHSMVESFGGHGKTAILSRVYPTKAVGEKARLFVFNNGESDVKVTNLNAYDMRSAKIHLTAGS
ncbi:hypothetical protein GUJ93_ZPchr0003g17804 [Zizania palustris]|uniref:beta-fructofuranosidase n=1 Tax=Zizania palustris TaxID=103762 RepID=A0A8J5SVM4_ZIZPA|nr:hypothetical protein GUJ93_ZPchr0003g17804 [Zizania palustris]